MTTLDTDRNAIGDVHCLNCGRALAQLIHDPDGQYRLVPTVNQSTVQVIVAGRRLLRCRRCGGRAFVELREETPVEELAASQGVPVEETPVATPYSPRDRRGTPNIGWRVAPAERAHRRQPVRVAG